VRARTARRCAAIVLTVGALAGGAQSAVALRAATPPERRAILPILTARFGDRGECRGAGYLLKVSTVNGRYLRATFDNRLRTRRGCSVGDGYSVYHRGPLGRYRRLSDYAWDVAPCRVFGVRLALDLTRDAHLPCG
jgi:hypothetical protein